MSTENQEPKPEQTSDAFEKILREVHTNAPGNEVRVASLKKIMGWETELPPLPVS
jgi:hypothetical protein